VLLHSTAMDRKSAIWFYTLLAAGLGVAAAALAALPLSPVVAFFAGVLVALFAVRVIRDAAPDEGGAADEAASLSAPVAPVPMPSDFGRALIEKLPTPLLVITRTGRVSYANTAARNALPRLQPESHFSSLIRAPVFVEAVTATLSDGAERWVRFSAHQGRERFYEARVGLLPPGGAFGPEALAIVQVEDRTETQRAEQLRSDFIANASHELRTPLSSIIGYIETLQNHARKDPEARERFLGIMAREAGRMQRLVDDLMSLSRIEMTEHVRPVEEWSLNQIAAESATALLPVAAQQGVTLKVEVPVTGARVLGDRDQLAQVFTNLIDNAMKYAGKGATVRVLAAEPSKAHPSRQGVTVADDGPGIPREHVHRLTERFYRVSVTASRNKGGTGLGLAIAKHILNRHEGRLEISSKEGEGSAFTVWLPRSAGEAPVLDRPAAPVAVPEPDRRSA
jgi:two-component system phosphate regulon sensor histidine kinase PhoR